MSVDSFKEFSERHETDREPFEQWRKRIIGMQREETIMDVLAETNRILERIANSLEAYNNAAIRGLNTDSNGQIEIFVTNHEA